MGVEAECNVRFGRQWSQGKARLETDTVVFRGDFRLTIPLRQVTAAEARDGELRLVYPQGTAVFELGPQAEKWAAKILKPKTLIDKLGVKPGYQLRVEGIDDQSFLSQLTERVGELASRRFNTELDLVFIGMAAKGELKRLKQLQRKIKRNGAIWVVWLKDKPQLKESDIRAAALEAGLVDVKVVKFSESQSALKLVIPVERR
jgi:hypothetical protein